MLRAADLCFISLISRLCSPCCVCCDFTVWCACLLPHLPPSRYRVLRLVGEGTFSQLAVAEDTFAPSPPSQHHLAGMYGSATINEAPHTSSMHHHHSSSSAANPSGATPPMIPRHRLVALKIMNSKYAFIGVQELDKLYTLNQRDQRSWCPIVRVQGPGAFYFHTHLVIVLELLGPSLLAYMKTLPRGRVPVEQLRKIALQLVLALGYVSTAGMIHGDIKPEVRGGERGVMLKHTVFDARETMFDRNLRSRDSVCCCPATECAPRTARPGCQSQTCTWTPSLSNRIEMRR